MSERAHYTDEQKAEALVALDANEGNLTATAKALGIPRGTLKSWRDRGVPAEVAQMHHEKRAPLADRLEALAHTLLDDLDDRTARAGKINEKATALGIAIDKARLLRGESTSITESHNTNDNRSLYARLKPPAEDE